MQLKICIRKKKSQGRDGVFGRSKRNLIITKDLIKRAGAILHSAAVSFESKSAGILRAADCLYSLKLHAVSVVLKDKLLLVEKAVYSTSVRLYCRLI